jgi:alpha-2-macroglobulin-like protein
MNTKNRFRKATPLAVAVASGLGALLAASSAARPSRAQAPQDVELQRAAERAVQAQLDEKPGRELYMLTDKPLYHPGESVWFRAWELQARSLTGTPGEHGVTFQLIDPRGGKLLEKRVLCRAGMATNDFPLPADLAGGQYTLRARSDLGSAAERAVTVSTYEVPRLRKSIELTRKSYGPGDSVVATVEASRSTGEPLTGARASAVITIDGTEIARFAVAIDARGRGTVRFQLPSSMARGDGTITLTVDGGGVSETIQKRIPIVLADVEVELRPEGGDLVSGLASRVYVAARDKLGKPAEIEGRILDDTGKQVAQLRTLHAGMARFALTPQPGRTYALRLTRPAGNAQSFQLPAARASGCVLAAEDDFASKAAELRVRVACTEARKVVATAVLRERLVASALADVPAGAPATLSLASGNTDQGAVRVTLFDEARQPLAERLVYRNLGRDVRVTITPDKASYSPREKVTLRVKTTDAAGHPVAGDMALAVVDDSVLRMADSKTGNVLSQLYLEPEMPGQQIFEPNFYFSGDPRAPEALDLVMGTRGWRRFAWKWVGAAKAGP